MMNIAENLQRYIDAKNTIAEALTKYGVAFVSSAKIDELAELLLTIEASAGEDYTDSMRAMVERTAATIKLPDGTTKVGDKAFIGYTGLTMKSLPSTITSLGVSSFEGCTGLAFTVLPTGIKSIPNSCFSGCTNLLLSSLPTGLTSIAYAAFKNCTKLPLSSLPTGLKSVESDAYAVCV